MMHIQSKSVITAQSENLLVSDTSLKWSVISSLVWHDGM